MRTLGRLGQAALLSLTMLGCGGSPSAPQRDEVFYLHGGGVINTDESWETYYEKLDAAEQGPLPQRVGVGILRGDVRFRRPMDWAVRSADYTPGKRFISYQSPRRFLFSIVERVDPPNAPWPEVLERYEAQVDEQGGQILHGRMPSATANTQGRSYYIKQRVASKPDYHSHAHEVLIRGERRVLLVQMVHGENIEASADEMVDALRSIVVY